MVWPYRRIRQRLGLDGDNMILQDLDLGQGMITFPAGLRARHRGPPAGPDFVRALEGRQALGDAPLQGCSRG